MCKTRSTGACGSHICHLGGWGTVGSRRLKSDMSGSYLINLCYYSFVDAITQRHNLMEIHMTTKAKVKTVKPYVATPAHVALATTCGEALNTAGSAKERAHDAAGKLHAAKAEVGAKGKCPLAVAFINARFPKGLNAKGKKVSAGTIDTVLGEFRKAVKTGKGYDENAARKAGKKTGAKTGGGSIMIALSPADKAETAAGKLRKGFEKMRSANDDLAELAAYLVDALDDAGFGETEE